jgi:hypothetical protein
MCESGGGSRGSVRDHFLGDAVEDSVDEAVGIRGAESFGELDGFVDGDFGRGFREHHFAGAKAEDGAVDGVDTLGCVVVDDAGEDFIDGFLVEEDFVDELVGAEAEGTEFCFGIAEACEVGLFGEFLGVFDHAESVGDALEAAEGCGDGFELAAEGGEVFDALEEAEA